jgi:hypothetical protein
LFLISGRRAWKMLVMPARFQEEWGGELVRLGAPQYAQEVALWARLRPPRSEIEAGWHGGGMQWRVKAHFSPPTQLGSGARLR